MKNEYQTKGIHTNIKPVLLSLKTLFRERKLLPK